MQNHDWIELFRQIPESQHNILVLTTLSGVDLSIETVVRTELSYLVFRGRVCGQTDDGRLFFLPYQQIDFMQVNRVVKEAEMKEFLGEKPDAAPKSGFIAAAGSSPGFAPIPVGPKSSPGSFQGMSHAPGSSPQLTPASPQAPAPVGAPRAPAGRQASAPTLASRMANVPAAALQPQAASARMPNVPAAALVPPPANGAEGTAPAPPRNSILERLRAQRNAILPPRPPAR